MGSFIFYESFSDAINELKPADRLKVYDSITAYVFKGKEPNLSGVSKAIFALIKPQLDANKVRYENGLKGGAPKGNSNARKQPTVESEKQPTVEKEEHLKTTDGCLQKQPNENVNENVNVNDKEKYKEKTAKRFIPPTEAELLDYCIAKSIDIDVEAFMDFYASKGWKVGSQPMKDWQAAVRNWARRDTARSGTKAKNNLGTFGNYKQTSTDDEWNELMQLGG